MKVKKDSNSILIIGGAGYIGSHVDLYLRDQGYSTLILDNLIRGSKEAILHDDFIQVDIQDKKTLNEIFSSHHYSAVMHFAAYAYVGESVHEPLKYYNNNLGGMISLLECMQHHNVNKLIFSSTCATYGNPNYLPIDEKHPQKPVNPYGWSKLMAEQIMSDCDAAWGLKTVALRYFNAAGEDPQGRAHERHDPETHLIPLVLHAAADPTKEIQIFGTDYDTPDGTCIRDYIHVTDLAQAHVLALEYLLKGGESQVYNLGNGTGYSVREVIDAAKRVTGKEIVVRECPRRPGDPPALVGSADKIIKELGWKQTIPNLEDIIRTAWRG
ncbi:UDP-glucose 4-epimerase GalE [uncultured Methanospirillum sp.]|uniref:UDP-glucose 4-epimerase GalE n=1 Tax=uncultured Methanospirillum sp. TaxID=262503 RepID=UPI0029C91859|nr:UDP-glucose 4-epimerase GalE [uncultured Methanospirillum sp.]